MANPTEPKTGQTLLAPAQSQPEVIVNQDVRVLAALIGLSVLGRAAVAPPGSPADGDVYIPAVGATGAWTGHDQMIAINTNGTWTFVTPWPGLIAYVRNEDRYIRWTAVGSPNGWVNITIA